jgi:hypothetical protein
MPTTIYPKKSLAAIHWTQSPIFSCLDAGGSDSSSLIDGSGSIGQRVLVERSAMGGVGATDSDAPARRKAEAQSGNHSGADPKNGSKQEDK